MDDITSLIDKSLLRSIEQTGEDSEEPRLLMLETIREYGQELLASGGEAPNAHQAHAEHFLLLAEEAVPALDGPLLTSWLDRLEQEHDNVRAALHWFLRAGHAGMALCLCSALERFWVVRGYRNEGLTFLRAGIRRKRESGADCACEGAACRRATLLHAERL